MSTYARVVGGVVVERFTPPVGVAMAACWPPDVLPTWVDVTAVSPSPQPNWVATQTNGAWHFAPPAAPVAPVPDTVSPYQARAAMLATASKHTAGKTLLDDVQAFVDAAANPRLTLAWEYASVFSRRGLFVTNVAPQLGQTDADLDALFVAAAAIVA